MFIVRVLMATARPALVGGVLTAVAAGGYLGFHYARGNSAASAFQQIQGQGARLVVSEFGEDRDSIVAIDPNDVRARTTIATVDHARGYGIFATLSPDGRAIAYTALPANVEKPTPDTPAQAAVVDVKGKVRVVARDVDLLVAPVWSPDGTSIVVRKSTPEEHAAGRFALLRLGLDGSRLTITTWSTAAVFPIAFARDGSRVYFATLNAQGSDLYSVAPGGAAETRLAHLSDQISRDWKLSPDGTKLAYSVAKGGATPHLLTKMLDLATGVATDAVVSSAPRAELNPTWNNDNTLTIAAVKPGGGADAVEVDASGNAAPLTHADNAIDLPLAWSPDGGKLAVRSVEGKTLFDAGSGHVELVDANGNRAQVSSNPDVLIVGWLR